MLEVETVKLTSLYPDPGNARIHDEKNLKSIVNSLHRFGQRKPIVVTHAGMVIAGNGTLQAAEALGWDEIAIARAPRDWDDNTVRAYALADNQTAILADWDEKILKDTLYELEAEGWDITELGFDELIEPPVFQKDPDEVPDVPAEPKTKLGDLYQLGEHRVLCGDSTNETDVKKLMDGGLADLVFTDPPYGVGYTGGAKKREGLAGDEIGTTIYSDALPMLRLAAADHAALYLWYADAHAAAAAAAAAGYVVSSQIIWVKNNAQFVTSAHYKGKHEPCFYAHRKGKTAKWYGQNNEVTVWEVNRAHKNEYHPTQKPVELAERAIRNSSQATDTVLDLFGGSGSTMMACELTNRVCRTMELSPAYVDVIVKRWEDFTGKKAELLESGVNAKVVDNGDE